MKVLIQVEKEIEHKEQERLEEMERFNLEIAGDSGAKEDFH